MIQFLKVCRTVASEPRVISTGAIAYFDYQPGGRVHLYMKDGECLHLDQDQTTIEKMLAHLASGASFVDYRDFLQS